jgi:hypothetical protein
MVQFARQILVNVRDGDGLLVPGATIKWTENGKDRGSIDDSDGHGTLTITDRKSTVEVTVEVPAEYHEEPKSRLLAAEQENCEFVYPNIHVNPINPPPPLPPTWSEIMKQHFPAVIGVGFVLIAIFLAFAFANPSPLQIHIILAVLSLGGGAFGTEISGMIKADLTLGAKFTIAATGAAAIFVILYFAVPAGSSP